MRYSTVLAAVIALGLQTACSTPPKSNRLEKKLSSGERARMLLELAAADIAENDPTNALIVLNESKSLDDEIPDTYYLLALAYYQKNQIKSSIESAQRAIALNPKFSQAKNTLGKLYLDQGRYAEAEKVLLEASNDILYRESYVAKGNLGILYYKKLNLAKAEPYLNQAIAEGGESMCAVAYYRGMIKLERNQLEQALGDFNRSTKSGCAKLTDAHLAKGQTLIRMKRYDLARAKMLEIQQLFPMSDASDRASQYLKEIP